MCYRPSRTKSYILCAPIPSIAKIRGRQIDFAVTRYRSPWIVIALGVGVTVAALETVNLVASSKHLINDRTNISLNDQYELLLYNP